MHILFRVLGKTLVPFEIVVHLILLLEKHENILISQQPDHASAEFSLTPELNLIFEGLSSLLHLSLGLHRRLQPVLIEKLVYRKDSPK